MADWTDELKGPTAVVELVRIGDRLAAFRGRKWIEFVALFIGVPFALAFFLPPSAMFPVLFSATLVGAALLCVTPGFRFAELARGWARIHWRFVGLVGAATALAAVPLVLVLVPGQFLLLPRVMPELWLTILVLYPLLSALPQELLFRPLFFRRYGELFPGRGTAVMVNSGLFALAHLMFWNWPAVAMTFLGGMLFAHAYIRGGFATAVAAHAVAGLVIFTSGLGTFFYHGAVPG